MRISVNLATRPYVELRPLYIRLRVLIVVLALIAVPLWLLLRVETVKAAQAHARLAAIENATEALEQQQRSFQTEMHLPQNADVLQQARFLNGLFARKAFSWTAVMMDLENVLPTGVQVMNIDPAIANDGDVTIRLRVSGQRDRAVDLVRNLEHSRRFLAPRLAAEAAETAPQGGRDFEQAGANGVNFDVLAEYNPLPAETAPAEAAKTAKAAKTAPNTGKKKSGNQGVRHSAPAHPSATSPGAPPAAAHRPPRALPKAGTP
jgi:type IV pilus assembly protein PilN